MKILNFLNKNKKEEFVKEYYPEAFNFIYKMGINKKDSSDIIYNVFVSLCSNEDIFNEGSDIKLLMYQGLLKSYDEYIKNKSPNKKRRTKKQYNKNFKNIFKELDNEDKKILLLYHYSDISLDKINLLIGKTISDIKISLSKSKFYIYQKYLYCKAKEDIIANYKKHLDELSFNLELKKHSETCEICLRKVKAEEELMAFIKENVINNFENDSTRKKLLIYAQNNNNSKIYASLFDNVASKTKKIFYFAPMCLIKSVKKNINLPKFKLSFKNMSEAIITKMSAFVAKHKDFNSIKQKTKNKINKISRFFMSAPLPSRLRLGIILSIITVVISFAAYGIIEYLDAPASSSFVYEPDNKNNSTTNNSKENADTPITPSQKNAVSNHNTSENKNGESKIDLPVKDIAEQINESPSKETIPEETPIEIKPEPLPIGYPDDNENDSTATPSQTTSPTSINQSPSQNTITPKPTSEPTFTPRPTPKKVSDYDVNFFIPTTTPKPDTMFIPTITPKPKPTRTSNPEPTSSPTPTPLPIGPIRPAPKNSPTPTPSPIPAIPVLPSEEPTPTDEDEPTSTPEPTDTPTPEPDPTETPTPEPDPTDTPTPTPEPTDTPTPTPTPEPTDTLTPTPEPTDTPTPTPEPTDTPTPTPEPTDTPTPTPGKGKPPWAGEKDK